MASEEINHTFVRMASNPSTEPEFQFSEVKSRWTGLIHVPVQDAWRESGWRLPLAYLRLRVGGVSESTATLLEGTSVFTLIKIDSSNNLLNRTGGGGML